MVNLPKERITSARPFRYCGVYLFGPFLIKQGMEEVKCHRVRFTCLASRGVHMKTAHLLEINSFMNTVRKFIARWWPVCKIRSDQRTNIVGTQTELKKALEEIDHDDIPRCPSKDFTEWVIKWKNNLPDATHMGGVWEYWWRNQRSWCCPRAPSRRPLFISVEQQIVLFCYLKPCVFPTPITRLLFNEGQPFSIDAFQSQNPWRRA